MTLLYAADAVTKDDINKYANLLQTIIGGGWGTWIATAVVIILGIVGYIWWKSSSSAAVNDDNQKQREKDQAQTPVVNQTAEQAQQAAEDWLKQQKGPQVPKPPAPPQK